LFSASIALLWKSLAVSQAREVPLVFTQAGAAGGLRLPLAG
jgi:hypothetical protein